MLEDTLVVEVLSVEVLSAEVSVLVPFHGSRLGPSVSSIDVSWVYSTKNLIEFMYGAV
jgi:hypothetical protein